MFLFDDMLAPLTSEVGFIEADRDSTVSAFLDWAGPVLERHGIALAKKVVRGQLKDVLLALLPLSAGHTRSVWIPTRSQWTAFFDNGLMGSDAGPPMQVLSEILGCRAIRMNATPHTMPAKPTTESRGRYGATILEVYIRGDYQRTLYSANDGGKWTFGQSGTPFGFEQTDQYSVRKKRDRFTVEMLDGYLQRLGIWAFDKSFYVPRDSAAVLIAETPDDNEQHSLEEMRSRLGLP